MRPRAKLGQEWMGSDSITEIEVIDPRSGSRGWVYLMHFSESPRSDALPPSRSSVRYAHFDVELNRVVSTYYELQYADGYSYFTGMQISEAAGGSGRDNGLHQRIGPIQLANLRKQRICFSNVAFG